MGSYYKVKNGKQYGPYERKHEKHLFKPRDIARIIDRMRVEGNYDDYTIARAVTDAFGVTNLICSITKLLNYLKAAGIIFSILMFLKAIKNLIKAIRLLKLSPLAKIIEYGIGFFKFTLEYTDAVAYAHFLVLMAVIESIVALFILYIDLMAGGFEILQETDFLCQATTVLSNWQPAADAFIKMNDDWYGILDEIQQEHDNLKQYQTDMDSISGEISSLPIPDS